LGHTVYILKTRSVKCSHPTVRTFTKYFYILFFGEILLEMLVFISRNSTWIHCMHYFSPWVWSWSLQWNANT